MFQMSYWSKLSVWKSANIEIELVPELTDGAFAIVSQILEFWENSFFNVGMMQEGENTAEKQELHSEIDQTIVKLDDSLKYGKIVSPKEKPDGAWNFHTTLRCVKEDSIQFETIYSRPSLLEPAPRATAAVWFEVKKVQN